MDQERTESLFGELEELDGIVSEDGHLYRIKPFIADVEAAQKVMRSMEGLSLLSSDTSIDEFKRMILSRYTVVVDMGCGVVIAYNMRPKVDTDLTFIFFDSVVAGRQKLILSVIDWYMRYFSLNRVTLSLPIFAFKAINRYKRIGFRLEGRKSGASLSSGIWHDVLTFGLTRDQLSPQALEKGYCSLNARELKNYQMIKVKHNTEEMFQVIESS